MKQFLDMLAQSLSERSFVSLTFSKPSRRSNDERPLRVKVRPVDLRGRRQWQWTRQFTRSESHDNLDDEQTLARAAAVFGSQFLHAHLFTTDADYTARIDRSGCCRVRSTPPTKSHPAAASHDRPKNHLLPEGTPCRFLQELGVMTASGRVHRSKRDKFRQINRFLEFVEDVLPHLPQEGRLEVVDFGCGLSYLTFALHHLLTQIHNRDVRIQGIDQNRQVIERCTRMCHALGIENMEFVQGTIAEGVEDDKIHLAVTLHACDTATDEALAQAVRRESDVILAAPCCQHELAPQINSEPLSLLTRHGVFKERLAAMATDALRAALLQQAGYRTDIIEFIDTEHTPKNLLLRAVRRRPGDPGRDCSAAVDELKSMLGIEHMRLIDLVSASGEH